MVMHSPRIANLCDGCDTASMSYGAEEDIRWTDIIVEEGQNNKGSWLCFTCYASEVDKLKVPNFEKLKTFKEWQTEFKKPVKRNAIKKT